MKVRELIDKLKEFDGDLEVVTWSDYDECGNGTIDEVRLQNEFDGNETRNDSVMIRFEWDGDI